MKIVAVFLVLLGICYGQSAEQHEYSCDWKIAHCDFKNVVLTSDNLKFDLADFKKPSDIKSIKFVNSSFPEFPTYMIGKVKILEKLDASFCHMTTIGNSFRKYKSTLDKIKEITFSNNQLSFLENTTFTRVPYLQQLDLSSNNIDAIDGTAFNGLWNLQKLDLSNNQISKLNSSTFEALVSLAELHLQGNQMEDFNFSLLTTTSKKTELKLLDLSSNNIKTLVTADSVVLKKLEKLDLSKNKLEDLQSNIFDGMTNLAELHLEKNRLKTFDFSLLFNCKSLRRISLQENQLQFILNLRKYELQRSERNKKLTINVTGQKWNCAYSKQLMDMSGYFQGVHLIDNDEDCTDGSSNKIDELINKIENQTKQIVHLNTTFKEALFNQSEKYENNLTATKKELKVASQNLTNITTFFENNTTAFYNDISEIKFIINESKKRYFNADSTVFVFLLVIFIVLSTIGILCAITCWQKIKSEYQFHEMPVEKK